MTTHKITRVSLDKGIIKSCDFQLSLYSVDEDLILGSLTAKIYQLSDETINYAVTISKSVENRLIFLTIPRATTSLLTVGFNYQIRLDLLKDSRVERILNHTIPCLS
jgi:hypothetical protein